MWLPVFDGQARPRVPWLCLALAGLWLAAFAPGLREALPPARFGLGPGAFALPGGLVFFALHTGAVHLVVSLVWLGLAGPALEDRFGRPCFAALLVLATGAGAALTLSLGPGETRSLVGASAGLAALLGASTLRFRRSGLVFRLAFGLRPSGRVALPALALPVTWLVGVVALRASDLGAPATAGPDLRVLLALGVAGAVCAGLVGATGLEDRWRRARGRSARERRIAACLARAEAEVAQGHPEAALALLETALFDTPDVRVLEAMLGAATACGRRGDALAIGARAVAERWHEGMREAAARLWAPLVRVAPDLPLDMRLRLGLAPLLAAAGLGRESALTLRGELRSRPRDVTPGAALRIADAARSLHPPTAVEAARLALASDTLDATKRARIEAWIDAVENDPRALAALDLDRKPGEPAPSEAAEPVPGLGDASGAAPVPDPQALALPEAAEALEIDADGNLGVREVEDPRALALDTDEDPTSER